MKREAGKRDTGRREEVAGSWREGGKEKRKDEFRRRHREEG